MCLACDGYLLSGTLPQHARSSIPLIEVFCITHIEFVSKSRHATIGDLRYKKVIVIIHQAKGVNVHQKFSCEFFMALRQYVVGRRVFVVKNIQVMNKAQTIFIVEDNGSFFNATIQDMEQG